jgi:hypothetical protein
MGKVLVMKKFNSKTMEFDFNNEKHNMKLHGNFKF